MIAVADCREWLPTLEAESCDSCVTDPPYMLGFMGKEFDNPDGNAAADVGVWSKVFRVLKPGAHLLAFGGTRTYHRLVCAIENAGFEVRDTIVWIYGQGFPKSLDVSKAIDKAAGAEREVVGRKTVSKDLARHGRTGDMHVLGEAVPVDIDLTAPATPEAARWEGWGTALKPAMELICVARKSLSERTVAANVLKHGTGGVNVDGCRIPCNQGDKGDWPITERDEVRGCMETPMGHIGTDHSSGRWPANLVLSEDAAAELDAVVGERASGGTLGSRNVPSMFGKQSCNVAYYDRGGPSRYFATFPDDEPTRYRYCAKASRAEREAGCEGLEERRFEVADHGMKMERSPDGHLEPRKSEPQKARNSHPTVKPLALMRWLVRLVTPPGGRILDPFAGSGTTCIAAALEGFSYLACEKEEEYAAIAEARLRHWTQQSALVTV